VFEKAKFSLASVCHKQVFTQRNSQRNSRYSAVFARRFDGFFETGAVDVSQPQYNVPLPENVIVVLEKRGNDEQRSRIHIDSA